MHKDSLREHPIIFFDGVCGMCNGFVDIIIRADIKGVFRFAALQGETAKEILPAQSKESNDWSMIYVDDRGVHDQSDASLEIYRRLGGLWTILGLARLIPRCIRTPAYRVIARNRYRWFGQRDACRSPTKSEKEWFLP